VREDDIRLEHDEFICEARDRCGIVRCSPAPVDTNVAALDPTKTSKRFPKCSDEALALPVTLRKSHQHADPSHPLRLLRARRERPRGRRAAEERDEIASFHSITSSARASSPVVTTTTVR
jgi:hypothetical protein